MKRKNWAYINIAVGIVLIYSINLIPTDKSIDGDSIAGFVAGLSIFYFMAYIIFKIFDDLFNDY